MAIEDGEQHHGNRYVLRIHAEPSLFIHYMLNERCQVRPVLITCIANRVTETHINRPLSMFRSNRNHIVVH